MELLIGAFIIWPIFHVLVSSRSHGGAKFAWLVIVLFFSWLAYLIFLISTQTDAD